MAEIPTNARKLFGDIASPFAEYTDKVLFGDVWERRLKIQLWEAVSL